MPLVVVRPAQSDDFEAIRDLFDELDRFHAAVEPRLLRIPPVPRFLRDEFDELMACATCFLAVAEQAGEVVGFVEATVRGPDDPTDVDRSWCGVHNLAVKQVRQREGIGAKLMRATEGWAQDKGLTDIRLNVFEFNAGARAFYERLGYRTLSRQLHKPTNR